jgi:hypothetical protein
MRLGDLTKYFTLLVYAGALVLAVLLAPMALAITGPRLYLRPYVNPTELHLAPGEMVTIDVQVDSGDTPVDAINATVTYPTDKLELTNVNPQGSAFNVPGEERVAPGSVQIVRERAGTPLVGPRHITDMTFVARAAGVAMVDFAPGATLRNSEDGTRITPLLTGFSIPIEGAPVPTTAAMASPMATVDAAHTSYPVPSEPATTMPATGAKSAAGATALPAAGAMTAMGAVGLGAMGAAGMLYIRSRRTLRQF